jgi:hypothetical protein
MDEEKRDDAALQVFQYAEQLVGADNYGGGWIDRSLPRPTLGMALVAPSVNDVSSIQEVAKRAEWPLIIDDVRYSRAQLLASYDGLEGPNSDVVVSFGWDARVNKVAVDMTAPDDAAVAYFRDRIPEDALLIRYVPYGRALAF